MAQRNDEDLLSGADLEAEGIPDLVEHTPGQVLADDAPEGVMPVRDYPVGSLEYGTTAAEQASPESVRQRAWREEPDVDVEGLDDEYDDADRPLAGRLVQPDGGVVDVDETPEELGEAVPDAAGLSAEEAAMRVVTDPEGLGTGGDGYLDDDVD